MAAAIDVQRAKEIDEKLWEKKHQAVKRKCKEYEEINDVLFTRAKRIRQMIEKAESERKFLVRRLQQFQVVEFPRCRRPGNHRIENDNEADNLGNGQQESSKFTTNGAEHKTGSTSPRDIQQPKSSNTKLSSTTSSVVVAHASNPVSISMATLTTPPVTGGPPAKGKRATKSSTAAEKMEKKPKRETKGGSKKRKGDADPNAPKKPSNAFFWFCQEHRPALQVQIRGNAFGQHDLTKALAKLWGETGAEDRKRFYELYAVDKKRYDGEMSAYAMKLQQQKSQQLALAMAPSISTKPSEPNLDTSLDASDDSMMM